MTEFEKAKQLQRLVLNTQLDEGFVFDYLIEKSDYLNLLKLYFSSESEMKTLLKFSPSNNPPSEWTSVEMTYYNINVMRQNDITTMLPLIQPMNLNARAKKFLDKNRDLKEGFEHVPISVMRNNENDFQRNCYYALNFYNEEARVDRVMEIIY